MSRKLAREDCFKLMFEYEFLKAKNDVTLASFLDSDDLTDEEKSFVTEEYEGLLAHNDELEQIISKYLNGYTIGRVYKVDLSILKIAVYEMLFSSQKTPVGVVINEAVELAKKYSTDKSYGFVNGVLASVNKGECENAKTAN